MYTGLETTDKFVGRAWDTYGPVFLFEYRGVPYTIRSYVGKEYRSSYGNWSYAVHALDSFSGGSANGLGMARFEARRAIDYFLSSGWDMTIYCWVPRWVTEERGFRPTLVKRSDLRRNEVAYDSVDDADIY